MPAHIERLATICRHYNTRTKRSTWTAAGRLFTGRGCHLRALASARRLHAAARTFRMVAG